MHHPANFYLWSHSHMEIYQKMEWTRMGRNNYGSESIFSVEFYGTRDLIRKKILKIDSLLVFGDEREAG